jgi:hypothetical protein
LSTNQHVCVRDHLLKDAVDKPGVVTFSVARQDIPDILGIHRILHRTISSVERYFSIVVYPLPR